LKYIITIQIIILLFTSCQKKIEVRYVENKTYLENINFEKDKEIPKKKIKFKNKLPTLDDKIVKNTIAVLYSSNIIGKYAIKVSNIATSYAINENDDFHLKFIDLNNENYRTINKEFNKLRDNNITKIMFFISPKNVNNLNLVDNYNILDIYLPLVNESNSNVSNSNIVYGGIDYKKQLDTILNLANSHIIEIYDTTAKSLRLHNNLYGSKVTSYMLSGKYPNYKKFIKSHDNLNNATIILNMNIIKNSIFLSQITANDNIKISQALSTQSTYSPLLFSLTQTKDTKKLIVLNSILSINSKLDDINRLLKNNIKYDWVNYSTILGFEYLKYKNNILFDNIQIKNNQIQYPINIYKTYKNSFIPYTQE
jgi:hypothetical protein